MTDREALPVVFGSSANLTFHGPLSGERAGELAAELAARNPATVADYGCGWGELLLRVLDAAPAARGFGVDLRAADIAQARERAESRGVSGRVEFVEGSATENARTADVVISSGAYQAFGSVFEALKALRTLVNPGGVLLLGAEFWERKPTGEQLAAMWPGTTEDESPYLADLVDGAVAAGFRPLRIRTAARAEWEEFESGYAAGAEEWLLARPGHAAAGRVRAALDEHRSIWLRGYRDAWGFAYLTLGVPAAGGIAGG